MKMFVILFLFVSLSSYSEGPWSSGLLPGESYYSDFDKGFSGWTNYIHKLNLRAEATLYSDQESDPPKYIVIPTNLVDTHTIVVGESNFYAVTERVVFTNLVGTSTNTLEEFKTLRIGVNALSKIDDLLISLMTNFVDTNKVGEAGGATAFLNEPDYEWRWKVVRPELCYCVDYDGNPVPANTEEECYSDQDDYYNKEWICPDEAHSWVETQIKKQYLPQLTYSSVWERLELPMRTNVTILYNYTKTGFGWEFERYDDYQWEETYEEYRKTNYIYGFSVSHTPITLTQSISRINYNVTESFADNYTIAERIVGNKKEVVVRAEKEFILEAKPPVVLQNFESSIDYNTADLSQAETVVRYNYSFTNRQDEMFFEGLEILGSTATDSYGNVSNVSLIIGGFRGGHDELPDGIITTEPLVLVDEAFGNATFLPVATVTNYYGIDEEYDVDLLVQSVFEEIPDWSEGVGYADVVTTVKDYYIFASTTNRIASAFSLSELSSTNYLDERVRVLDLMNATWNRLSFIDYYIPFMMTPGLHVAMRTEPFDGAWLGQFNDAKPSNHAWTDLYYDRLWSEDYDPCNYLTRKTVRTYSGTTVNQNGTTRTNSVRTFYTPDCAEGSPFMQNVYLEAPWNLYWQDNNKRILNNAYPLTWSAGGVGDFIAITRRENGGGRSVPFSSNPSRYTEYSNSETVESSHFFDPRVMWPKNTGIIVSNFTTNISAKIYQYAVFDNVIGAMTYTNKRSHYTNSASFNANNNCGAYNQTYELVFDFAEPPIAKASTNWVQYVPPVTKPLLKNWAQFEESRYGVNDYPSSSWLDEKTMTVTCVDGFGTQGDTSRSWSRSTHTDTIGFMHLKYPSQTRTLNTMIFIMDWDFD